jgi:hypothetical protein
VKVVALTDTPSAPNEIDIHRGFSRSIMVSALRCTLTYILLPFVAPFLRLAPGVGPAIGLPLGFVAIVSNGLSIRRFWRADHRWKKPVTVLHVIVIGMLAVLIYRDIASLLS